MNKEYDASNIGETIRLWREQQKESQATLAEVLGTTDKTISKLELGSQRLTFKQAYLICCHYHKSLDALAYGDETVNNFQEFIKGKTKSFLREIEAISLN